MHPNPAYRWEDRDAMRALTREIGFGALFAATPDGPRVAHLPFVWQGEDAVVFHIARGNGIARHLDGATALLNVIGPGAYVSPDWYGEDDQVPTWNYVTVELEGTVTRIDEAGLVAQIDALSAEQEARLAPKPVWTRAKMDPKKVDAMLRAIIGFRLDIQAWRGTRKLAQAKSAAARAGVADALDAEGRKAIAHWMRHGT